MRDYTQEPFDADPREERRVAQAFAAGRESRSPSTPTSVETLDAAIQKLEALREQGGGSPWRVEVPGIVAPGGTIVCDVFMYDVHADLIVTLHRTIDPQLRVLTEGKREYYRSSIYQTDVLQAALALAGAIIGDAS